jgi:hypothetical protein
MTTETTLYEEWWLAAVPPATPLADSLPMAHHPTNEPIFQPISNPSNPRPTPLALQNQGFFPIEPKSPNFQTNPFLRRRLPPSLPLIYRV